jgi:hypothetical protein
VLNHYKDRLVRRCFEEFALYVRKTLRLRRFLRMKAQRKERDFLLFWRDDSIKTVQRRRRRILAEVMGNYCVMGRCFAKIRLFNYLHRKIKAATKASRGGDKHQKRVLLGGTHMRNYFRLAALKAFFHRWWNRVAAEINWEVAVTHDWERLMGKVITNKAPIIDFYAYYTRCWPLLRLHGTHIFSHPVPSP